MSDQEKREPVSLEDLVYSQLIQLEAVTRLLVKRGVITKEELLEEVKAVNAEQHSKAGGIGVESGQGRRD